MASCSCANLSRVRKTISGVRLRGSRIPSYGLRRIFSAATAALNIATRNPCLLAMVFAASPDASKRLIHSAAMSWSTMSSGR